jgi:hypothetical protein
MIRRISGGWAKKWNDPRPTAPPGPADRRKARIALGGKLIVPLTGFGFCRRGVDLVQIRCHFLPNVRRLALNDHLHKIIYTLIDLIGMLAYISFVVAFYGIFGADAIAVGVVCVIFGV